MYRAERCAYAGADGRNWNLHEGRTVGSSYGNRRKADRCKWQADRRTHHAADDPTEQPEGARRYCPCRYADHSAANYFS
ncbi:hypothetical protein GFY24_32955 [Nocardia sp. SYP-A9097]|uniref:hypothetical protein n=1 Tax=Nocardia sp. SYP-A9097 TaxID=2663237 RepID=UPI00129B4FC3|nr:hypothetical protein [Nocardia sp. SYP-A9097]MRH92189.1 hypothetical protein [Nocardia sp. SYP-A9097]